MPLEIEPQSIAIRNLVGADPGEFMLFLGAGASKSSGIPLAGEMIQEWRQMLFEDSGAHHEGFEPWCAKQPWFDTDAEYSVLFEKLFPHARARQKFIEPRIERGFPAWCYLYLANLIQAGRFNVVFTTNFDDLVNDALSIFLGYNPVVCAAESQVGSINTMTQRAKILKLHGDYLFKQLKNTRDELDRLDPNMEGKLSEFARQCGLVVIGYAGRDRSVMRVIEAVMEDPESFPSGIWWGVRDEGDVHPNVCRLMDKYPRRFKLFLCRDFDDFMAALHHASKLPLPESVLHPYEVVRMRYARLNAQLKPNDANLQKDIADLERELNRMWNKERDRSVLDLLQAQLALGRRDHVEALEVVATYLRENSPDADCLTVWGDALAMKCEAEMDAAAGELALEKWREAIRLDPNILTARYSLMRYGSRHQLIDEAVRVAEELQSRVPGDRSLQRNLAQLLMQQGRPSEAMAVLDELLKVEPSAAELHAMRCGACEQRGLIAEGLAAIEKAVALEPSNPWYRFTHANGLSRAGQRQWAGEEYQRTIELAPQNLGFRLQIAQYLVQQKRPLDALRHLEEARKIEPASAEVRGWLAEIYLSRGRIPEARTEVNEALRLTPGDVRLLVNLGIIALREGALAESETALTQAMTANPLAPQPHYWMALLLWAINRSAEAQAARNSLAALNPQVAAQLDWQVQTLMAQTQGDPRYRVQALQLFMSQEAAQNSQSAPVGVAGGPPPLPR
jgi:tetratricopeptide (TPR) repeat protein